MLLQEITAGSGSSTGLPRQLPLMVLQGSRFPFFRGSAFATGDTIHEVLKSTTDWTEGMPSHFGNARPTSEQNSSPRGARNKFPRRASRRVEPRGGLCPSDGDPPEPLEFFFVFCFWDACMA